MAITDSLPELDATRERVAKLRAARPNFTTMSNLELYQFAEPFLTERQYELMKQHMFITAVGSIPVGIVTGTGAVLGLGFLLTRTIWGGDLNQAANPRVIGDTKALGLELFTKGQFLLPFEIVSVLLLVAMVGVILLSKKELK